VAATTNTGVITSRDYGQTWTTLTIAGATAVSVCPAGNIIWIGCINQASTAQLYYSEDYGQSFIVANQNPQGSYISTSYLTIATNHDGSIIVGGGNDNLNRFRLQPPEVYSIYAGTGISISSPFGLGSYQISSTATNDYQLWFSGSVSSAAANQFEIDWTSAGKIDLALYDIKYEIDIHWDYSGTASSFAFLELGINTQIPSSYLNFGIINTSVTNWTNNANNGNGGIDEYNQSYINRFYCGFSGGQGIDINYRYRTKMTGELSLANRPTAQSGITDESTKSRLLLLKFNCDNALINNYLTDRWGIWANNAFNTDSHHSRIHGSSLFEASFGNAWTAGSSNAMSLGIYRFLIRMSELNPLILRTRGGQVVYRIYRIKK
jgi:hypothetical protein